jgi:COP9 signalosome complex subunit 6
MSLLLGRGDATRDVRRRAMEAYKVHPLVLVEISDYFTRTKMNIDPPEAEPDRLIGCLLGTQTPREVEINSSFECLYARPDGANGAIELDWKFLSEQKDRYKQTPARRSIRSSTSR